MDLYVSLSLWLAKGYCLYFLIYPCIMVVSFGVKFAKLFNTVHTSGYGLCGCAAVQWGMYVSAKLCCVAFQKTVIVEFIAIRISNPIYIICFLFLFSGASFTVGSLYPQLDFTACFLKLLQFTIICHLHWSLAARTLHREDIVQHVINPVLCLYILYCTTVALMGMVDVTGTWTECMRKSLHHEKVIY